MKIRITFFLLFSFFLTQAQSYQPTAIEGAHWQVFYQGDRGQEHFGFSIEGDTVYNDVLYKKVYHLNLTAHFRDIYNQDSSVYDSVFDYFTFDNKSLYALIRDDFEERKVYAVFLDSINGIQVWKNAHCDIGEEGLVYDFSLAIGDTLVSCATPGNEFWNGEGAQGNFVIDQEYSGIQEGLLRKTYEGYAGNGWTTNVKLYEGLGFDGILFWNQELDYPLEDWSFELINYCIGTDEECLLTSTYDRKTPYVNINVFPNPAQETINWEGEHFESWQIWNTYGQLIQNGIVTNPSLNISYLQKGIYYLVFTNKEGVHYRTKFLKN